MARTIWGLLVWTAVAGGTLGGSAAAQTLNIASSAPVTSIDPHYHTLSPNESFGSHIYERLVDRDAGGHMIGGLAESWKLRDDRTWEFKLRTATFHDGTPFTAEDVAYTLARVPRVKNSPASFSVYSRGRHQHRDRRSPHHPAAHRHALSAAALRPVADLHHPAHASAPIPRPRTSTAARTPSAPAPIVSSPIAPATGSRWSATTATGAPSRTGSTSTTASSATTAPAPPRCWPATSDVIEFVPPTDLPKLRTDPRVTLEEVVGNRAIYLWLDQSRTGPHAVRDRSERRNAGGQPAEGPPRAAGAVARDQPPGHRRPGDGGCGGSRPANTCRRAPTVTCPI